MNQSSARLFSILFAISVVLGFGFFLEYSQQATPNSPDATKPNSLPPSATSQSLAQPRPQHHQATPEKQGQSVTYVCKGSSGSTYRDYPCHADEKEVRQIASATTQSSPDEFERIRKRALQMEEGRTQPMVPVAPVIYRETKQDTRQICDGIDRTIAGIDAQTRQPHGSAYADYLRSERKSLMDKRFSAGC